MGRAAASAASLARPTARDRRRTVGLAALRLCLRAARPTLHKAGRKVVGLRQRTFPSAAIPLNDPETVRLGVRAIRVSAVPPDMPHDRTAC